MPDSRALPLTRPVISLSGVGPERAALLGKLAIHSIEDLLLHRPRRYEDRQRLVKIADLRLHEPAVVCGKVVALGTKWFRQHTRSIFELVLDDTTARLHCRWWNLPYLEKYFHQGDQVLVFGKPLQLKPRTIDHPETEVLEAGEEGFIHLNRLTPIYPLTEGLGQRWLRALIWRTLQESESAITEPGWGELPGATDSGLKLPSRALAIRHTHFPETLEQIDRARRRLALDELVELQQQIQSRRRNFQLKAQALPCAGDNRLLKPFLQRLEFKLTGAQTHVLREIRRDMSGAHPMRRLLQGDVGSGKTLVAACTALMTLESGFEVALMAPTELLAEQHFSGLSRWFAGLGIGVQLRTGSRRNPQAPAGPAPSAALADAAGSNDGIPSLFVGTHALFGSAFNPERLGLVIIDEQHKFGVVQREQLLRKGRYPHLLVMTATPIPRTLGLTLYGDLDVSVLDELPPGRGRIKTFVRTQTQLPKVWDFIRKKISEGRQAYVVYPHIEDEGARGVKAVSAEFERLHRELAPLTVGMLHGRLPPQQREQVMAAFRSGTVQVLVATSVLEVGVDVPNATVMLIENAEQFGLAQLHQLRGRIGRGAHDSFCVLVPQKTTKNSQERLRLLEQLDDGFRLAEADLKLRGPGELLGQQQSGLPRFRFADLSSDLDLIREARDIAQRGPG